MLDKILHFSKPGFYGEKVSSINEAVTKYADAKTRGITGDELAEAKSKAEELCSSLIAESGFSGKATSYISVDKDFFTPEGALDEKRLERFEKEIVRHYASEQLKWSFAGTTGGFTQITKSALLRDGRKYEELLPVTLRDEEKRKLSKKNKPVGDTGYKAFIYQDGTVTGDIVSSKMKVRFDICKDASGFDWKRGFSPDNKVDKKEWVSGFNNEGVWEKVHTIPGKSIDRVSEIANVKQDEGANDSLGIMVHESEAIVFDSLSRLFKDSTEAFYSINGELYGARSVDRERSVARLKEYLADRGVKRIDTIVASDAKKDTIEYYKKAFSDYVDGKTTYHSPSDKELVSKIESIEKVAAEKNITGAILERFAVLSEKGVKGPDLFSGFEPESTSAIEEVPLNIFGSSEDMETFFASPAVSEAIEPEVAGFIRALVVPDEKKAVLSNAVQTIAHNYVRLFRHTPVRQIDVMRAAAEIVVKNRPLASIDDTKLVVEKTFSELVLEGSGRTLARKTDIFFAHENKVRTKGETWETEMNSRSDDFSVAGISREAVELFKTEYANVKVPDELRPDLLRAVEYILPNLKEVIESTGMKPAEIVGNIVTVLAGKQGQQQAGNKRVFFEKSMRDFILESSAKSLYGVRREKKRLLSGRNAELKWKPFDSDIDLSSEKDLDAFLASPFLVESGFGPDEHQVIANFIRTSAGAATDKAGYSRGLLNLLRGYKHRIKPRNVSLDAVLESYAGLSNPENANAGSRSGDQDRVRDLVAEVAGLFGREKPVDRSLQHVDIEHKSGLDGDALGAMLAQDSKTLLTDARIAGLRIPPDEAGELFAYLGSLEIPNEKKTTVLGNVARVLDSYASVLAPSRVKAIDAVSSAVSVSGLKGKKADAATNRLVKNILASSPAVKQKSANENKVRGKSDSDTLRDVNIFSEDGYKSLVASEEFVKSGLDATQFGDIVRRYADAYAKTGARVIERDIVPLAYADASKPVSIGKRESGGGDDNSTPVFARETENSIYTLGYAIKNLGQAERILSYARQGSRLLRTEIAKSRGARALRNTSLAASKSVVTVTGINPSDKPIDLADASLDSREAVIIDYPNAEVPDTLNSGTEFGAGESAFPLVFSNFQTGSKLARNSNAFGKTGNTNRESALPRITDTGNNGQTENANRDAGNPRMARIEENYNQDKRMLARSASGNPLKGSSQADGKSGSDEGNVVQQLSDDLLEELKRKTLEDGF